jgi:hypothetical protein
METLTTTNTTNTNNLDNNIELILRQTDYTKEIAIQKLQLHNNNPLSVIKEYMGIPSTEKKTPIKSLNQEIYKQIRCKLDTSMREFREKNSDKII